MKSVSLVNELVNAWNNYEESMREHLRSIYRGENNPILHVMVQTYKDQVGILIHELKAAHESE